MNVETRTIDITIDSNEGLATAVKQVKDLYNELERAKAGGFYLKSSTGKITVIVKRETHKKAEPSHSSGGKD